jgi:hypothetical protein
VTRGPVICYEVSDSAAAMIQGTVLAEAMGWVTIEGRDGERPEAVVFSGRQAWGFRLTDKGAALLAEVARSAEVPPELTAQFLIEAAAAVALDDADDLDAMMRDAIERAVRA